MTNEQLIQTAKEAMRNDTVINKGIVELLCNALVSVTEQRDAVIVEMQSLKTAVLERIDLQKEIRNAGRPPHADFWHQSIYLADKKVDDALQTPATSSAIAALRAEGVEMFAAKCRSELSVLSTAAENTFDESHTRLRHVIFIADDFARQLRESKGAYHE